MPSVYPPRQISPYWWPTALRGRVGNRLGILRDISFQRYVGLRRFYTRYPLWQIRKRLPGTRPSVELPTGLRLPLPKHNTSATEVYLTRCNIDWGGDQLLMGFLEPHRDFVDVGANFGYYSLLAAPLARTVHAFEPDPRNLRALEQDAKCANNVIVWPAAVGAASSTALLDTSGPPTVSHLVDTYGPRTVPVDMVSLDDFASSMTAFDPAAIKIDVEGFDLDVIRGGLGVMTRSRTLVFTEFNLSYCNTIVDLFGIVTGLSGYTVWGYLMEPGRNPREARLRELRPDAADYWTWKMLFLVPSHLRARFVDAALEPQSWTGS